MKGGRGTGGPTGRSRRGTQGRWGDNTFVYRTPYGYCGCCIPMYTMVYIHSGGPRAHGNYADDSKHDNCADPTYGCTYELPQIMTRDEFDTLSFVASQESKFPYYLYVSHATLSATSQPQMYFTFWTDDNDGYLTASYVLLPVGCVIIVAVIVAFVVIAIRSRSSSSERMALLRNSHYQ